MKNVKHLLFFLIIFSLKSIAQFSSDQLLSLQRVSNFNELGLVSNPYNGNLIYVDSQNTTYQFTGLNWEIIDADILLISTTELVDIDSDTKIEVHDGNDNDEINFHTKGVNVLMIDTLGKFQVNSPKTSILIGNEAAIEGKRNLVIGRGAFKENIYDSHIYDGYGDGCIAVGFNSLHQNQGGTNLGIGSNTLQDNLPNSSAAIVGTNFRNDAIGHNSHYSCTECYECVSLGESSFKKNTTGEFSTAVGSRSLFNNISAEFSVALGYQSAFRSNSDKALAIGAFAMVHNNGINNNVIGYYAQLANANNSNQVRIGNTDITHAAVQVAWSISSDLYWKEKVRDLPYGMNLISKLRPVDYVRKNSTIKTREVGFIAQELVKVLEEIGFDDQGFLTQTDQGHYEVRYNDFIPIAIKGIQEQQVQLEKQQAQIDELKANYQQLIERFEQLKP
ncbi:MAG: tail fiber domain-containing protein [Flavobacteriales bacterium]|nr:tail fiber domain-containing protein [Flavobacteriales bacterium]